MGGGEGCCGCKVLAGGLLEGAGTTGVTEAAVGAAFLWTAASSSLFSTPFSVSSTYFSFTCLMVTPGASSVPTLAGRNGLPFSAMIAVLSLALLALIIPLS